MTSVDTPPQKPPRPEGGGSGSGGVRRVNSIPSRLSKDDSNLDNNNNNNNDDDDDDDTPQQAPPPKGVFARLRDKFASTFELGSLGSSQQGNGIPQVVSRNNTIRPARSCIRGANSGAVRSGALRFDQSCVVYFFNIEDETNVLVETRRDVVVGRRLRFQTESSVDTAAAADAQSALPSLTSSDTTQLPPRKIIQRRVQVDGRSPPPPLFLQQQATPATSSDTSSSSSSTATTSTSDAPAATSSSTTTTTTASSSSTTVDPPRLKSPPPTLPSLLDLESKTRASDDKDDDSDGSDDSPPPLKLSPARATTKSVAVTSPRSPRGGGADTSVAASAPSRFGDTGEWLSSNPVRPSQPSLNLAKHREDGSLDRRADTLSPRALSTSPEVSPKKHKHKHKTSSKPTEELDAVIAIVDDHETRRQQKAVDN